MLKLQNKLILVFSFPVLIKEKNFVIKTWDCNFRSLDLISDCSPVSVCDCSKLFNLCLSTFCTSNGHGGSWEFFAFLCYGIRLFQSVLGTFFSP